MTKAARAVNDAPGVMSMMSNEQICEFEVSVMASNMGGSGGNELVMEWYIR